MKPAASSFSTATGLFIRRPATALWAPLVRLILCFVAVLVVSLFAAPGKAQAHAMHGSTGEVAVNVTVDDASTVQELGGSEISGSSCVVCCASSVCVVGSVPDMFRSVDVGGRDGGFPTAKINVAYQRAQHGLRRPPRQNS